MAKKKFYVVWEGVTPGIYTDWITCKLQVQSYKDAKYKSYETREEADKAYAAGYKTQLKPRKKAAPTSSDDIQNAPPPNWDSIAVDAACSGNPGDMEYRGVYVRTGQQIFRQGPFKKGTNNIGEFLALVHGLAQLKREGSELPIYSDSRNAISWVKQKKCKTKLERTAINEPIFNLIARAERWLQTNTYTTQILKWETKIWGEIPADFGRK